MLAYVLLSLKGSDEKQLLPILQDLEEVKEAHVLFGEWDVIALVEVDSTEELGTFMMDKIRTLPEVKLSSTLIVAK